LRNFLLPILRSPWAEKMKDREIYILMAIAFLFFMGSIFVFSRYQERLKVEEEKLKKIEERIKVIKRFQKVDREWQRYAEEFLFSDISSLREKIEELAKDIRIENWRILSSQKKNLIFQHRGKIVFYATYENFIEFLKNLEKYPSVKIKSFSIKSISKEGKLNVELEFLARTLR